MIEALRTIYDPEIPVNIYDLGLIYDLQISPDGVVRVSMTLTSPACPVAGSLPREVEARLRTLDGVADVNVDVVWDPPWSPERMSDAAKLHLNL
jgi:FeS assembly SUF system protein